MKLPRILKQLFNYNARYKVASHIDKNGKLIISTDYVTESERSENRQGENEVVKSNLLAVIVRKFQFIMLNKSESEMRRVAQGLEERKEDYNTPIKEVVETYLKMGRGCALNLSTKENREAWDRQAEVFVYLRRNPA